MFIERCRACGRAIIDISPTSSFCYQYVGDDTTNVNKWLVPVFEVSSFIFLLNPLKLSLICLNLYD